MLLHFENYALILVRSVHVSIKKKKLTISLDTENNAKKKKLWPLRSA
jgi:hypothetical protein